MDYEELYKKYGDEKKKSKKKIIAISCGILVAILVLLAFVYFYYPEVWAKISGGDKKICEATKVYVKNRLNLQEYPKFSIVETELETPLSKICNYSISTREYNRTSVNISSCDMEKIVNGLEHPESLNLDDIEIYSQVIFYSEDFIKNGYEYINERLADGCNIDESISSIFFLMSFTATQGTSYLYQSGNIDFCLSIYQNFTDTEKKECLLNLLDAEKSALTTYSQKDFGFSVENCSKLFSRSNIEPEQSFTHALSTLTRNYLSRKSETLCQMWNEYSNEVATRIMESNESYFLKYVALSGLLSQKTFFNESHEVSQILLDNMKDTKYRTLFENNYRENGFI